MKPAKFEYLRPSSLDEALQQLSSYGEDSKIISGGQSLIPLLNMRLSTPKYLIDISRIDGLNSLKEDGDHIVIGATVRQSAVERSPLVKEHCGILTEAVKLIGHQQIRSRGTVCGSIAHGDPSAELPLLISTLRGEIVVASVDGERIVSPDEFFLTYLLTTIEPHEMVKEVRFPKLRKSSGYTYLEVARTSGDFALVGVACVIDFDEDKRISDVKLGIGGASPVPVVLEEIEQKLIGKSPSKELFEEVTEDIGIYIDPEEDLHATAEYRSHLATVLTKRALLQATDRALGGVRT